MYLVHTRLNLAYALSIVSIHDLGEVYMNAVMRILKYLKFAIRKGILFTKNIDHECVEAYTDVDWVGIIVIKLA